VLALRELRQHYNALRVRANCLLLKRLMGDEEVRVDVLTLSKFFVVRALLLRSGTCLRVDERLGAHLLLDSVREDYYVLLPRLLLNRLVADYMRSSYELVHMLGFSFQPVEVFFEALALLG